MKGTVFIGIVFMFAVISFLSCGDRCGVTQLKNNIIKLDSDLYVKLKAPHYFTVAIGFDRTVA